MVYINESSITLRNKAARAMIYLNADGKCEYCGCELKDDWQVDHYLAWCRGGKTKFGNLKASCKKCNLKKGVKIMDQINTKSPWDYEKMSYFSDDFPNAKEVRICQKGAYNCVIDKLHIEKSKSCSIFLPTGTGKSDVVRMVAEGLVQKRKLYFGGWAFSPNLALRNQLAKDKVDEFYNRLGYSQKYSPFMTEDCLDNKRFRNDCILESFTIQFLTNGENINLFIDAAKKIYKNTGKYPFAIFDEGHLYSVKNEWGAAARKMQEIGIPIILITGTPFRSDNIGIPGFREELISESEKKYVHTKHNDDPTVMQVIKGNLKVRKFLLKADYEYTYSRAWGQTGEDQIILKPEPIFVDATEITYNEILSEMSRSQVDRLLRAFLMDERTIKASVSRCVDSIRQRKIANSSCCAIVATLSDDDEFYAMSQNINSDYDLSDMHAKKIEREFNRQAPDLKVLVVTSKTNSEDGLENFRTRNYDVMIVKAMGTIGFNHPPIKTVLNLSNYRTITSITQLTNRGCRLFSEIATFDVIMPKDKGMIACWQNFEEETGLEIEKIIENTIETEETKEIKETDKETKHKPEFDLHNISINPINKRSKNDEIIEMFKIKLPSSANTLRNQGILIIYEDLVAVYGKDWLEKLPSWHDRPKASNGPLLDCNEEETRLRTAARDIVKEITNEIISILGKTYNSNLYRDIHKNIWTCVKRCCGFRPNQSLENISGIDNYEKIVNAGNSLKNDILRIPEDRDFDYERYLLRYKCH